MTDTIPNIFEVNKIEDQTEFDITLWFRKNELNGSVCISAWSLFPEHKPHQCLSKTALDLMDMLGLTADDLDDEPFEFQPTLAADNCRLYPTYEDVVKYGAEYEVERLAAESEELKVASLPTLDELLAQVAEIADKIVKKVGNGDLYVCTGAKTNNNRCYSVGVGNNSREYLLATIPGPLGHPYKCILNGPNANADMRELSIFLFDIQNGLLDKIDAQLAKVTKDNERFNGSHIQSALEKAANWK